LAPLRTTPLSCKNPRVRHPGYTNLVDLQPVSIQTRDFPRSGILKLWQSSTYTTAIKRRSSTRSTSLPRQTTDDDSSTSLLELQPRKVPSLHVHKSTRLQSFGSSWFSLPPTSSRDDSNPGPMLPLPRIATSLYHPYCSHPFSGRARPTTEVTGNHFPKAKRCVILRTSGSRSRRSPSP
jgi:hypothetical protein